MSPSQFQTLIDNLHRIDERLTDYVSQLEKRIRRIEIWAGGAMAGITLIAFLIANNMIAIHT